MVNSKVICKQLRMQSQMDFFMYKHLVNIISKIVYLSC